MKTTKQKIIDSWLKTKTVRVRPSYAELAKKYGVTKAYCFQVVTEFKKQTLSTKEKNNERFI